MTHMNFVMKPKFKFHIMYKKMLQLLKLSEQVEQVISRINM